MQRLVVVIGSMATDLDSMSMNNLAMAKLREFAVPVLFVASLGLLCQSAYDCDDNAWVAIGYNKCSGYLAYAVSVGAVSTVVVLVLMLLPQVRVPQNAMLELLVSLHVNYLECKH